MGRRVRNILGRKDRRFGRVSGRNRKPRRQSDGGTGAAKTVKRTTFLPHEPECVWRALTDRDALSRWLLPASDDIVPTIGHRFSFTVGGAGGGRVDCAVVEATANHRLVYTWQDITQPSPSRVAWTLEPAEGGTLLHLRHDAPEFPGGSLMRLSAFVGSPIRSRRAPALHRRTLCRASAFRHNLLFSERTLLCR